MTTPINTFEDILDAMERDPALRDTLRRHILTDELLQMPLRLEQFITEQRDFNEDMRERSSNSLTRLDRMEGDSGNTQGTLGKKHRSLRRRGYRPRHGAGIRQDPAPQRPDGIGRGPTGTRYRPELPKGRPGYRDHQGRGPAIRRPGGLVHRRPAGLREGAQERRAPDTVHRQAGRQPALPASETPTRSSSSWNRASCTGTRWRTGPRPPSEQRRKPRAQREHAS